MKTQPKGKKVKSEKTKGSHCGGISKAIAPGIHSKTDGQQKGSQLQPTTEDWQQTFDAIPHFVSLISPDFEFIRLNRSGCECLGKSPEQVIGKSCCWLIHGQDTPVDGCPCVESLRTMKPEFAELILNGRNYIATASPVLNEKGNPMALVHTVRDITQRKRTDEELRKYRDQLEELVKERTAELRMTNEKLQSEIAERKRVEKEMQRSYEAQSVLNQLLSISLENASVDQMLERIITHIVSIPWLASESKGAIFLVEDDPGMLVLKAQKGLDQSLQTICSRVPFGRCLCGRAAQSGKIEFVDSVNEHHLNRYQLMPAHGHYCVPVLSSDKKVLGVVCLYLKEGHSRVIREEKFLETVANILAGIMERRWAQEKIMETAEELKIEQEACERKNVALHEIMNQIDAEKKALKQRLTTNVEQTIIPTLHRLKQSSRPSVLRILEMLEKDLLEIVSPFMDKLKSKYSKLSPRELEVCRLIKNGMTSKDIAEAMNLSLWTVYKYRDLIRKKLGLVKDGTNLQTFLQSL